MGATAVAVLSVLGAGVVGALGMIGDDQPAGDGRASVASASAELLATSTTVPPSTVVARVTTTTARPATTVTTKAPPAASNGTSLTVEVSPKRPKAGETVRFVVTASQPGNCCYLGIQPGDGGSVAPATGSRSCTAAQGGTQRAEFTYVYNRPGTWTAVARSDAGRACDIANAPPLPPPTTTPALPQLVTSVTVVVAEGVTSAQGPEPPGLEGVTLTPAADGRAALQASAFDRDGWVARVEVDWGDGSPAAVVTPTVSCRTDESGWPVGYTLVLRETVPGPLPTFVVAPTHAYAAPGTYTVTVSAVSTGCDGTVPQRTTRTLSWTRAA